MAKLVYLSAMLLAIVLSGCILPSGDSPLITSTSTFSLSQGGSTNFRIPINGTTPAYTIYAENVLSNTALFRISPGSIPVSLTEGASKNVDINKDGRNELTIALNGIANGTAQFSLSPLASSATVTPTPTATPNGTATPVASSTATPIASSTATPPPTATPTPNLANAAIVIANQSDDGQLIARLDTAYRKAQLCTQTEFTTAYTNKVGHAPTTSALYSSTKNFMPQSIIATATANSGVYSVVYSGTGGSAASAAILNSTVSDGVVIGSSWLSVTRAQNLELVSYAESISGNCGMLVAMNR